MSKFKGTYRIESTRLKQWDYSNPWWYYVTINSKNHIEHFGNVDEGKMILNKLGEVVEQYWGLIAGHFNNIELDYFIIMPNHLHGIVIINTAVETPDRTSLPQKNIHLEKL